MNAAGLHRRSTHARIAFLGWAGRICNASQPCARADLKFHSSSRMKPRWLVFALTLPTEDVLFVQYTVPTIIMSRQCDQHSKARAVPCSHALQGFINPKP